MEGWTRWMLFCKVPLVWIEASIPVSITQTNKENCWRQGSWPDGCDHRSMVGYEHKLPACFHFVLSVGLCYPKKLPQMCDLISGLVILRPRWIELIVVQKEDWKGLLQDYQFFLFFFLCTLPLPRLLQWAGLIDRNCLIKNELTPAGPPLCPLLDFHSPPANKHSLLCLVLNPWPTQRASDCQLQGQVRWFNPQTDFGRAAVCPNFYLLYRCSY